MKTRFPTRNPEDSISLPPGVDFRIVSPVTLIDDQGNRVGDDNQMSGSDGSSDLMGFFVINVDQC